ncbi:MAG: hypothetical protein HOV79_27500 [Hamadaea sp.]|nr:hypothetical protein [Hamadaea sp.]
MPKIYAEKPFRFTRQLLADLFVAAWIWLWIWLGTTLYDLIMKLAAPGRKIEDAGSGLADNLADAQSKADGIPLVGDRLGTPFGKAAEAARSLAEAGQDQQDVVHQVALALGWSIGLLPILFMLMLWLPLRVRWVRAASAASRLRRRPGGVELLALRALTNAPLRRLATLPDDTAERWREGDRGIMDGLAELELRRLGLRTRTR